MFYSLSYAALLSSRHVNRALQTQFTCQAVRRISMATTPPSKSDSDSAPPSKSDSDSTPRRTSSADVQIFVRDGKEYTEVIEGLARILAPYKKPDPTDKDSKTVREQQSVFYNPIQQFNRDLTVLAIKAYGEELLSKPPRTANAKLVAKRKRDKSDTDGPISKRQPEKPAHVTEVIEVIEVAQVAEVVAEVAEAHATDVTEMQATEAHVTNGAETLETDTTQTDDVTTENVDVDMADAQKGTVATSQAKVEAKVEAITTPAEESLVDTLKATAPREALQHPKFTILDALSATGLRALRYAQELPFVTSVTANDLTPSAVDAIRRNAAHNHVESKVIAVQGDARAHMYSLISDEVAQESKEKYPKRNNTRTKKYNVIDLDPYGTAVPFLDGAVNAVRDDGGLLCVTCTDSAVWASSGYPEKSFSLYGGMPIKGSYSHEVGLRLILHSIATTAARYGLAMQPLLSLSIDYYARVFVTIRRSPSQVKFLAGKTMVAYVCDHGCGSWETQLIARNKKSSNKSGSSWFYKHGAAMAPTADSNCKHCNTKTHLAGPMYAGPLHSAAFIKKILDDLPNASDAVYGTKPRIEGMLQTALEELSLPPPPDDSPKIKEDEYAMLEPYPFYFHPTNLAGAMHCICPDEDSFRGALRHLGYEVTRSHCKGGSMKTNAPWSVVWHVMREWTRQKHPVKAEKIGENSPAYRLLRMGKAEKKEGGADEPGREPEPEPEPEVVFDQHLGRDKSKRGLVRYQTNPRENWGPQSRAKGH